MEDKKIFEKMEKSIKPKQRYIAGKIYGGTIADPDRNIKNEKWERAHDDKWGL